MAEVASYNLVLYGGPQGYQTNRAQIQLSDADGETLAWVRFNDPDMDFENDYEDGGIIRMHLPSAMFQAVLDVLRHEEPVEVYLVDGQAFLGTIGAPVGEDD
jgi:hypothetical protein